MSTIQWFIFTPFIVVGLVDTYFMLRFVRKPEIDKTAGYLTYWMVKWGFVSQTKAMAEKLPFVSQDLTEMLGIRPDDGKIT